MPPKLDTEFAELESFVAGLEDEFGGTIVVTTRGADVIVFTIDLAEENGYEAFKAVARRQSFIYCAGYRVPGYEEWVDDHVVQVALEVRDESDFNVWWISRK